MLQGYLKAKNQYQVFATVSGIIENLLVHEGDTIKKGDILFTISNEAQSSIKKMLSSVFPIQIMQPTSVNWMRLAKY